MCDYQGNRENLFAVSLHQMTVHHKRNGKVARRNLLYEIKWQKENTAVQMWHTGMLQ